MTARPLISIGIAFRNPGPAFVDCLRSVFAQTCGDWELLLMDDQSTDGSVELARSLADPRVRVYSDGKRHGLARRLNEMVALSAGKFFFRMDADDIMHPERLRVQGRELAQRSELTVLGTMAYSISENGELLGLRRHPPAAKEGYGVRRTFIHPTVAAHREWFRENPYSEDLLYHRCEDAELWCRAAGRTAYDNLSEPLLFYRETGPMLFERYAATMAGSMSLLVTRFRRPALGFVVNLGKEVTKLFLYGLTAGTNLQSAIISRKYNPLPHAGRKRAEEALEAVRAVELPVLRGVV